MFYFLKQKLKIPKCVKVNCMRCTWIYINPVLNGLSLTLPPRFCVTYYFLLPHSLSHMPLHSKNLGEEGLKNKCWIPFLFAGKILKQEKVQESSDFLQSFWCFFAIYDALLGNTGQKHSLEMIWYGKKKLELIRIWKHV